MTVRKFEQELQVLTLINTTGVTAHSLNHTRIALSLLHFHGVAASITGPVLAARTPLAYIQADTAG